MLSLSNLSVETSTGKKIIHSLSLDLKPGEVQVLMGPNGSGKSSLVYALAAHPDYKIIGTDAQFSLNGISLLKKRPEQRSRLGLFLAFQNPVTVDGVAILPYLRQVDHIFHPDNLEPLTQFKQKIINYARILGLKDEVISRNLNEDFSGGEKKRLEILQMMIVGPKYAILDEIDSGLDSDGVRIIADQVRMMCQRNKLGCLLITHNTRMLDYLRPTKINLMINGKIVAIDGPSLIKKIETDGFKSFLKQTL